MLGAVWEGVREEDPVLTLGDFLLNVGDKVERKACGIQHRILLPHLPSGHLLDHPLPVETPDLHPPPSPPSLHAPEV